MFCSENSKQRKKRETKSRYRKEEKQAAHGHSEQGLALDPPAHSHLLSSGCPLMDTTGSGEDTSAWGSADSLLQEVEDDMFPADWTPPRIEFLYHDDPPPLSPLPEPASDSRSSGEMPDITEEVFGPQEFTDEMTSSTQSPLEILNKIAVTQLETETRDVAGPGHFASSFCQSAKEELEGTLLVDQISPQNWTTFSSECSPLPSSIHLSSPASRSSSRNIIPSTDFAENPDKLNLELNLTGEVDQECLSSPYHYHPSAATSSISSGSSISASSDEFVGDLEEQMFDSDVERDMGRESLPSQLPTHPLLESTKISSGSSISSSSDEFVGDPLKMTLDTDVKRHMDPEFSPSQLSTHPLVMEEDIDDVEEDIDDSGLISLRDLLQTDDMNQSTMEPSTFLYSGPDGYLSSLDKLLEEKREQIREDEELERSLGEKLLLCSSLHSVEVVEESAATLPDAHRLLLKRFSISLGAIPAVHPGESIFGLLPYQKTSLALDTAGLTPQNQLENLFFK
uniref:Uncharacterized protein n=1 Tax=Sphaerodactylus townsendi TaxID=933632 RepID=A0ACB8EYW9_9SAUR